MAQKELKLKVENLTVSFRTTQGMVRAVRDVSFDLYQGDTLAIVGESGSGKSVTSRAIMGILAGNGVIDDGKIIYEGQDLTKVDEEHFHEIRGKKIGMIFQDPMSSLNPIMKIGYQITEGMLLNGKRLNNRYKALFNRSRTRYNELRRLIKASDLEYKQGAAIAKGAKLQKEIAALKIKLEKDLREAAFKEDRVKLMQQHNEQVAALKAKIADMRKSAPDIIRDLRAKNLAETTGMKKDLVVAKADLIRDKAAAKKTVAEEWAAERAKAQKDLDALRAKLDPNMDKAVKAKIYEQIAERREALLRVKHVTKREAYERAIKVMKEVGIPNAERRFNQYPFQFSGGMRQRIVIAIALTADPDVLICDEPTTALDVTIQSQILELINRIKAERGLTVMFITHDMGVVANMSNRIAVMYAGKIVEIGTTDEIFYQPRHPYTWALLGSMPDLDSKERLIAIDGTPPNMLFPPKGDAFAERSKYAMAIDFEQEPPMFKVSDTHFAATWLLHPNAPKVEIPGVVQDRIERMLSRVKEVSKP
jgi:oligopeptide transport system ATP-binding protein